MVIYLQDNNKMLKKLLYNILITTIIILGAGGAMAVPRTAHAACNIGGVVTGNGLTDCVNELVVVTVMPLTGKFLQLSAYLFDNALTLNMNIARFLQKPTCEGKDCLISPVEVIWKLIRDISGMFFIFILIWASIKMILGGDNSKNVIVGVVIAGLLVNFSLFATKIIIDASNAFTLTIYNAISPGQANVGLFDTTVGGTYFFSGDLYGKDGTVSSKIMQVVDLQSLFAATQNATKKTNFNVTSIVTVVGGAALMLVLGLAFLAAGLMFLWRFVMLLTLMAFSPIPALAYAFPSLKKYSSQFTETLLHQAFFAPIFLFFIYIALKVLTNEAFVSIMGTKNNSFANVFGTTGAIATPLIQYGLVIFVIFMGLITAKSFGAKGAAWGMGNITGLGKWTGGVIGRNTAGKLAKTTGNVVDWASAKQVGDQNGAFAKTGNFLAKYSGASFATKESTRALRSGLKSISSSKFGSSQSLDDIKKEGKEYTKKQRELGISRDLSIAIKAGKSEDVKKLLGKLSKDERTNLDKDDLVNPTVAQFLSESDYEAIDKSDKSDKDKVDIRAARKEILDGFIKENKVDELKNMVGKMTPKEVLGLGPENLKKPEIIAHLKASQLKGIVDDLTPDVKNAIRSEIENVGAGHQAHGYITSKERSKWGGASVENTTNNNGPTLSGRVPKKPEDQVRYNIT